MEKACGDLDGAKSPSHKHLYGVLYSVPKSLHWNERLEAFVAMPCVKIDSFYKCLAK